MGIFNDEWENEVYRLKAHIRELEKENKSLRKQLAKQKTQDGYGDLYEKESEQE